MSIVPEFFLNFFDKSMPRKTEVQDSTKKEHYLLQILWPAQGLAASEWVLSPGHRYYLRAKMYFFQFFDYTICMNPIGIIKPFLFAALIFKHVS